jgi:hypothetical protein
MLNKLNHLSFVIGLFFTINAIILLGNSLLLDSGGKMNLYTAIVFGIFGILMMVLTKTKTTDQ